jgi:hypothetical protein
VHAIRLIYASNAAEGLVYRDFLAIMAKAAEANGALGITGMLCYGGGKFLQALEGDRLAVTTLYHRISTDPRHSHCELLHVEDMGTRDFAEWTMKIVNWSDSPSAAREASLVKHSGSRVFDPDNMNGTHAAEFMRELAAAERLLLE